MLSKAVTYCELHRMGSPPSNMAPLSRLPRNARLSAKVPEDF